MKKLAIFNGTTCIELPQQSSPAALPQALPHKAKAQSKQSKLDKLSADKPLAEQLTLQPNAVTDLDEGLSTLLVEAEPRYYSRRKILTTLLVTE